MLSGPNRPILPLLVCFLGITACEEMLTDVRSADAVAQLAKGGGKGKPGDDPSAYTLIDLGPGTAGGISATGVVVGSADGDATLWRVDGTPVALGNLGAESAYAASINAVGTRAVGQSNSDAQGQQPVIWELEGDVVTVARVLPPVPGTTQGHADDVNDLGQAVGQGHDEPSPTLRRALLWESDGTPRDLGTLGGMPSAWAIALNNSGHVVGKSFPADFRNDRPRAVLWIVDGQDVTVIDLTPDSDDTGDNHALAVSEVSNGTIRIGGTSTLGGQASTTVWTVDVQSLVVTSVIRRDRSDGSPEGINASGEVALSAARVWDLSTNSVESLPVRSNRCGGRAFGLNDAGTVVGLAQTRQRGRCTDDHAVIWTKNEP